MTSPGNTAPRGHAYAFTVSLSGSVPPTLDRPSFGGLFLILVFTLSRETTSHKFSPKRPRYYPMLHSAPAPPCTNPPGTLCRAGADTPRGKQGQGRGAAVASAAGVAAWLGVLQPERCSPQGSRTGRTTCLRRGIGCLCARSELRTQCPVGPCGLGGAQTQTRPRGLLRKHGDSCGTGGGGGPDGSERRPTGPRLRPLPAADACARLLVSSSGPGQAFCSPSPTAGPLLRPAGRTPRLPKLLLIIFSHRGHLLANDGFQTKTEI